MKGSVAIPKHGIFCLEGDWTSHLGDRTSVEPQLRMLEHMRVAKDVIHRDVATRAELEHYLSKWLQKKYQDYRLGYFAFHGDPGCLNLGKDQIKLIELADLMRGRAEGRVLYFGSCRTLAASDKELKSFCQVTGVRAIVGYTRDIDWLESASFDFLLLPKLLTAKYMKPIYTGLREDHPRFARGLGLRMATATWCTDVKIARAAVGA